MKYFPVLLITLLLVSLETFSKNYYFSSSTGNDGNTVTQAQHPETPWRSLDKLNQSMGLFASGDSILFKRGDVFSGSVRLACSGTQGSNIVFATYGTGKKPILTGTIPVTGWALLEGSIWESAASLLGSSVTNFLIDGRSQQMGRYPNSDDPNSGYLSINTHSGSSYLTSTALPAEPDWSDGQAVIRTRRWLIDHSGIESHSGNAITLKEPVSFELVDGFGFFIQNHLGTLDQDGEWFYDPANKKMFLYSVLDPNALLTEATAYSTVLEADGRSYFSIENLEFRGSVVTNIYIKNAHHFTISNCEITEAGNEAVIITGCDQVEFYGNRIVSSNNNALWIEGSDNVLVKQNEIRRIGLRPGMGADSYHKFNGIFIDGDQNRCEANIMDSIGFNGIYFLGDHLLIKNNLLAHFCMTIEDGGGIYSWNGDKLIHSDRQVDGNIVLSAIGAVDGTNDKSISLARGIFLDNSSDHVTLIHNTVAHCPDFGIFLNFGNHIAITGNTAYDNDIQLAFVHDSNYPDSPITDCSVHDNVFFSKSASQLLAYFQVMNEADVVNLGSFDNNSYCRPVSDNTVIQVLVHSGTAQEFKSMDLGSWQNTYNHDLHSRKTPYALPTFDVIGLNGPDRISNGSFDSDIAGWSCWSNYNNCQMNWEDQELLDGGSCHLGFNGLSGNSDGELHGIVNFGDVVADEKYILRFSMVSSVPEKAVDIAMYKAASPYNEIAAQSHVVSQETRQDFEILITPDATEPAARIDFIFSEDETSYWLDNVELYKADVEVTNTEDSLVFIYNPGDKAMDVHDGNFYVDARGNSLNNFSLDPFRSVVLLKVEAGYVPVNRKIIPGELVLIYPNPADDLINIHTPGYGTKKLTFFDASGRMLLNQHSSGDLIMVDVSSFPEGIYLLILEDGSGKHTSRFMVY